MKVLKNKGLKNLILISTVIVIFASILAICFNNYCNFKYQQTINSYISKILNAVEKEYPNVNDEDLIKILNNPKIEENKKLLEKYGIYNEPAIEGLKQRDKGIININLIILIMTSAILIVIFYFYLKNRQAEIDKITKYVEKVSNKKYSLDIDENTEDELSSLKNELYKITVMLKEEADNSEKQKEALTTAISDISHQLKTPLTSILIMLDNLSESDNMDKQTRDKFIAEISRQIENMNWLVISLLKLSRLDAGVVEFESQRINANKLVNEVISNLEIMAELKNVGFEIEANKDCYFTGDYNWNKEAIQNIVKNAIEHTKANTKVRIKIEENSVYTSITIKDEGDGIKEKDLKHIFDRFYKSENSSENSFGIGLSLSKSIIEEQNGYIQVETEENKGTTFVIKYIK
jgi:signal transduction histidine kinase